MALAMGTKAMLEIVRDLSRLEAIADQWSELAARRPSPMLSHEWTVAAAKAYGEKAEMAVFLLWDRARLRAAAPLAVFRNGFSRHLRFLAQDLGEPDALLFEDRQSLTALLTEIGQQGLALRLSLLPRNGDEMAILRRMRSGSLNFERPAFGHAAILPPTAAQLEEGLSKSSKTMLRRKLKRAEKFGDVSFLMEPLSVDSWQGFLKELVRVEGCGWKGRSGTSLSHNTEQREFFEHYAASKAASGKLRGYRMLIDGQTAAIRLGVVAEGTLYELKIGFDEAFQACSPGIILTHETLKAAVAEGIKVHEFLGVAEDWQRHWPLQVHERMTVRRYPLAVNGALNLTKDVLDQAKNRYRQVVVRQE
jgi:CelD/BcsL family acetyltransferase involved in cellulose biosynthesis